MVWVLCELAIRPEYQDEIHDEIQEMMPDGPESLTHTALKDSIRTDSFIRETMRTKGDTFSTVRMAVKDVPMGGYIIPKGILLSVKQTRVLRLTGNRLHRPSQCLPGP